MAGVIGVIFHLNDMKVNDIAVSFKDGAKDLIGAALVVAMAQGIMQVLGGSDPTTPTVINTIMYGISQALAGLSGAAAAVLMYVFQSVFNFSSCPAPARRRSPCRSWHRSRTFSAYPARHPSLRSSSVMLHKPDRPDLRLPDRLPGDCKNRVVDWINSCGNS